MGTYLLVFVAAGVVAWVNFEIGATIGGGRLVAHYLVGVLNAIIAFRALILALISE